MYSYASHLVITVDDEVQALVQDSTISFNPLNDEFELVVKYYNQQIFSNTYTASATV